MIETQIKDSQINLEYVHPTLIYLLLFYQKSIVFKHFVYEDDLELLKIVLNPFFNIQTIDLQNVMENEFLIYILRKEELNLGDKQSLIILKQFKKEHMEYLQKKEHCPLIIIPSQSFSELANIPEAYLFNNKLNQFEGSIEPGIIPPEIKQYIKIDIIKPLQSQDLDQLDLNLINLRSEMEKIMEISTTLQGKTRDRLLEQYPLEKKKLLSFLAEHYYNLNFSKIKDKRKANDLLEIIQKSDSSSNGQKLETADKNLKQTNANPSLLIEPHSIAADEFLQLTQHPEYYSAFLNILDNIQVPSKIKTKFINPQDLYVWLRADTKFWKEEIPKPVVYELFIDVCKSKIKIGKIKESKLQKFIENEFNYYKNEILEYLPSNLSLLPPNIYKSIITDREVKMAIQPEDFRLFLTQNTKIPNQEEEKNENLVNSKGPDINPFDFQEENAKLELDISTQLIPLYKKHYNMLQNSMSNSAEKVDELLKIGQELAEFFLIFKNRPNS